MQQAVRVEPNEWRAAQQIPCGYNAVAGGDKPTRDHAIIGWKKLRRLWLGAAVWREGGEAYGIELKKSRSRQSLERRPALNK